MTLKITFFPITQGQICALALTPAGHATAAFAAGAPTVTLYVAASCTT